MKKHYDIIIIGAGHNGLTAAAYLAKAGKRVLVLEKRPIIGGAAATEALWPGFRVNTGADDASMFQDTIIKDLFLKMAGLEFRSTPTALFAPNRNGRALTLFTDMQQTITEIARLSQRDAAQYPAFVAQVNQFTAVLRDMLLHTPPDITQLGVSELVSWGGVGIKLRRLGGKSMMEFMRVLPMPAREYLDEWFESDLLKGTLGLDAVTGTAQGPRSAGTTLQFFYQHINGFLRHRPVLGGMGALSEALATAARQNGAEIRTEAGVTTLQIDNGRATSVLLENGDQIAANVILSSADARRTYFDLIGPQEMEPRVMRAIRNVVYRGTTAKLLLGLSALPHFAGQTDEQELHGRIRIAPSLDAIEQAWDAAKYGRFSPHPVLDITIPTLTDGTLAPAGQHIMSVVIRYAPYHLAEGNWATAQAELQTAVLHTIAQVAPDIQAHILHQHLITPDDYEQTYGLTEGSIFHGQMGLDQLLVMRPIPNFSQYRTPIENLFLCGAGSHPGGGVTGAPGYNAAQAVLSMS
jgi:phytoene dehydrogenase-like protein